MPRIARGENRGSQQRRAAVLLLKRMLADGPKSVTEIETQAKESGVSTGILRWAKSYCQVRHYHEKRFGGQVFWQGTEYTERVQVPMQSQTRRKERFITLMRYVDARVANGQSVSVRDLMEDWKAANPRWVVDTAQAELIRQRVNADFRYLLRTAYQASGDVQYFADGQFQWHEFQADKPAENDPTAMVEWANRLLKMQAGLARAAEYARGNAEEVCAAQNVKVAATPTGMLAIND